MAKPFVEPDNYDEIQLIKLDLGEVSGQQFTLIGQAIAGTRSSIIVPELGICLDLGFCSLIGTQQPMVLITHGHADHCGSLHFHAFERAMHKMEEPIYVMPGVCVDGFREAYNAYHRLGGARVSHASKYSILGVGIDQLEGKVDLIKTPKGRFMIRGYRMRHSVPAVGYLIVEHRKKLLEQYQGLSQESIGGLVKSGVEITYPVEIPRLAYTGDTLFRGVLENPIFFQAQVLIMECTYLVYDGEETQSFAKKRSHIHIQDIIDHMDLFQNQVIVLCHFSRRYKKDAILSEVAELDAKFGDRLGVVAFI